LGAAFGLLLFGALLGFVLAGSLCAAFGLLPGRLFARLLLALLILRTSRRIAFRGCWPWRGCAIVVLPVIAARGIGIGLGLGSLGLGGIGSLGLVLVLVCLILAVTVVSEFLAGHGRRCEAHCKQGADRDHESGP
jgi:hypothetical protein